jgi:Asp-tRNA(Asn)/Glu-tRNA(Gln) amidotransferase A subunit family amidase
MNRATSRTSESAAPSHSLRASPPHGLRASKSGCATQIAWPRRRVLKVLSALGVGSAVFGRALVSLAAEKVKVTEELIKQAEWISGLELTDAKRKLMVNDLNSSLEAYGRMRAVAVDNGVPPALYFYAQPAVQGGAKVVRTPLRVRVAGAKKPAAEEDLAFASVALLASLIQSKQISSVELTKFYLERLKKYDPVLRAVITFTDELAMKQAEQADKEIAAGKYRGALHGIPYGAKDLFAMPGYKTTWGSVPFKEQVRTEKAAVIERLEAAGAVLVAKTTLGELAQGDVWFGATTKNPWNVKQGSSGSSAGSAATTSAGLVGFAIGTETLGSIVSPCTRCGVTGLRPSFGRISRYGAMALSWSMDKVGPIARSAEDCAIVFNSIHGADPRDPCSVDRPFVWSARDIKTLRIGYVQQLFDEDRSKNIERAEQKALVQESQEFDRRAIEVLKGLGIKLISIKLPDTYPVSALRTILNAEAGAAFDELPRTGKDDTMVQQNANAWPNSFREAQFIPAVEYIRANRIRTLVMAEMEKTMAELDVYVAPSFGGISLLLTNLTGHPQVVVPHGFRKGDGTPTSIVFTGKLWGEAEALAVAQAYQKATDFHKKRPVVPTTVPEETKPAGMARRNFLMEDEMYCV